VGAGRRARTFASRPTADARTSTPPDQRRTWHRSPLPSTPAPEGEVCRRPSVAERTVGRQDRRRRWLEFTSRAACESTPVELTATSSTALGGGVRPGSGWGSTVTATASSTRSRADPIRTPSATLRPRLSD